MKKGLSRKDTIEMLSPTRKKKKPISTLKELKEEDEDYK